MQSSYHAASWVVKIWACQWGEAILPLRPSGPTAVSSHGFLWPFSDLITHHFFVLFFSFHFLFDLCDRLSLFNKLLNCTLNPYTFLPSLQRESEMKKCTLVLLSDCNLRLRRRRCSWCNRDMKQHLRLIAAWQYNRLAHRRQSLHGTRREARRWNSSPYKQPHT